jgi:hypothetical protein
MVQAARLAMPETRAAPDRLPLITYGADSRLCSASMRRTAALKMGAAFTHPRGPRNRR